MIPTQATEPCAAFYRVSTSRQEWLNQVADVEQLAAHRGLEIVKTYTVNESAFHIAEGGSYETTRKQMLADAQAGKFGKYLLVWTVDRAARTGIEDVLKLVRELRERGVTLISVKEPWLSGNDATTELLLAIAAWVARQESERRSERVKAGLARRKAEGKPVGRQPGATDRKPRKRSGYVAAWEQRKAGAALGGIR